MYTYIYIYIYIHIYSYIEIERESRHSFHATGDLLCLTTVCVLFTHFDRKGGHSMRIPDAYPMHARFIPDADPDA